jgi:hypothetical protein
MFGLFIESTSIKTNGFSSCRKHAKNLIKMSILGSQVGSLQFVHIPVSWTFLPDCRSGQQVRPVFIRRILVALNAI